jgi:hypothetical protein
MSILSGTSISVRADSPSALRRSTLYRTAYELSLQGVDARQCPGRALSASA